MKNYMRFALTAIVFAMVCSQLPLEAAPAKNKKKKEQAVAPKQEAGVRTFILPSLFGKLSTNSETFVNGN